MKKQVTILHNNGDLSSFIRKLQSVTIDPEKPVKVETSRYKPSRSLAQNRLNWMWCDIVRKWLWESGIGYKDALGEVVRPYTNEEIHEWHKRQCLEPTVVEIKGESQTIYNSHNLPVAKFTELLQFIDFYWGEKGLQLPHPEDIYYEAMGQ